ncbi:MAG: helix-turn-helix domain-containing protein [Pseudomonadota bacterium]
MPRAGSVRSLERGLEVLTVINQHNGIKPGDIARIANIPRPTVYRLIETLEEHNFVTRDHTAGKWRATLKTKTLSSGYRNEDWVQRHAVPRMMQLGRDILWPLDLVMFNDHQMEIRESTHHYSPYSIDHGMVGQSLPILSTASGRAYLAFSPPAERDRTLASLRIAQDLDEAIVLEDGPLELILERSRQLGLGFRMQGFRSATMSLSAPILQDARVVGCLTLIWTSSALKFDRALALYGYVLTQTAQDISAVINPDGEGAR